MLLIGSFVSFVFFVLICAINPGTEQEVDYAMERARAIFRTHAILAIVATAFAPIFPTFVLAPLVLPLVVGMVFTTAQYLRLEATYKPAEA